MALCRRCSTEKQGTRFWYEEFVKDPNTFNGKLIAHEICVPCRSELTRRVKATIMQVDSKAMRQGMLARLKQ
jgi:hypothetical protein